MQAQKMTVTIDTQTYAETSTAALMPRHVTCCARINAKNITDPISGAVALVSECLPDRCG